jgi:hypothetical protein
MPTTSQNSERFQNLSHFTSNCLQVFLNRAMTIGEMPHRGYRLIHISVHSTRWSHFHRQFPMLQIPTHTVLHTPPISHTPTLPHSLRKTPDLVSLFILLPNHSSTPTTSPNSQRFQNRSHFTSNCLQRFIKLATATRETPYPFFQFVSIIRHSSTHSHFHRHVPRFPIPTHILAPRSILEPHELVPVLIPFVTDSLIRRGLRPGRSFSAFSKFHLMRSASPQKVVSVVPVRRSADQVLRSLDSSMGSPV